ncbi:hypothetical protein BU17DRAFT_91691 [Hysterangium stoloniferum]|nr:hypothetical protein BU17DRAFT_91691 [Hysterangium stoloniferum]
MSPILGIGSHNNVIDDDTELGHADSSVAVPSPSTGDLLDLQGIIDYSTVDCHIPKTAQLQYVPNSSMDPKRSMSSS